MPIHIKESKIFKKSLKPAKTAQKASRTLTPETFLRDAVIIVRRWNDL
jgi:hypothetical protein